MPAYQVSKAGKSTARNQDLTRHPTGKDICSPSKSGAETKPCPLKWPPMSPEHPLQEEDGAVCERASSPEYSWRLSCFRRAFELLLQFSFRIYVSYMEYLRCSRYHLLFMRLKGKWSFLMKTPRSVEAAEVNYIPKQASHANT